MAKLSDVGIKMPKCFTIMSNEIEGRLDPFYYRPEFRERLAKIENSKFKVVNFEELITDLKNGIEIRTYSENGGFRYLRVTDLGEYGINDSDPRFVKVEKIPDKIRLKENDFLISRSGSLGLVSSVTNKIKNAILSSHIFKISLDNDKVNPKYLEVFFRTSLGQFQFFQKNNGGIVPEINQSALKSLKIILPPLETQNHIIALMDQAYKVKKQKEAEAKKLLDSINDYVLSELGIKMPELKDYMTFVVHADDVKGKRIDPYYYQPKFKEIEEAIESGKYATGEIGKLLTISDKLEKIENYDFINYVDLASIDKDLGIIKNYNKLEVKDAPSRARQKIEKGDLLLSSLSGSLKSIAVFEGNFDNAICSTGFYVIKNSNNYNNYYLWALFRSDILQILLQKECSGAIMSAVNRQALSKMKIPLPPLEIQNKIAEEVKRRMQKAEQLQKEAKEDLEKAKQEVEKIILGE